MFSRDLKYLPEEMRLQYYEMVKELEKIKLSIFVTCTGRTLDIQMAYYLRGRASFKLVNYYYKFAGLNESLEIEQGIRNDNLKAKLTGTDLPEEQLQGKIKAKQEAWNKYAITWTLDSRHLIVPPDKMICTAFDFAVVYEGKTIWNPKADVNADQVPDYEEVGRIAQKVGLDSGMFWSKPDYCHIQQRL